MKTTIDHAAEIRAALKAKGWSNRKVSVRGEYFSMGSAIRISIKDPSVPIAAVEAAAKEHERIDRCEITHEILSGCNRYVSVSYTHEAEAALAEQHREVVEKALAKLEEVDHGVHVDLGDTGFRLGKSTPDHWNLGLWGDHRMVSHYLNASVASVGFALALAIQGKEDA